MLAPGCSFLTNPNMPTSPLPPIPAKRYFTIGEVADLCGVKPHVLRYWEQEFTQLSPMKRRGNRRYYQHHEVLMVRRIRDLLYEQGFTISGARAQLENTKGNHEVAQEKLSARQSPSSASKPIGDVPDKVSSLPASSNLLSSLAQLRQELEAIRLLLD